jgi:hypothetical protein
MNNSKLLSLEKLILKFRYFIDESLSFIELYESFECESSTRQFKTTKQEIVAIKQHSIEYTRLVLEVKQRLNDDYYEFNTNVKYTESFKNRRKIFFDNVFKRLAKLSDRISIDLVVSNDLVKIYFRSINKIAICTNELIGYLELARWNREISMQIIDKLIKFANDFSCIFEKFASYLDAKNKIVSNLNQSDEEEEDHSDEEESEDGSRTTLAKTESDSATNVYLNSERKSITFFRYLTLTLLVFLLFFTLAILVGFLLNLLMNSTEKTDIKSHTNIDNNWLKLFELFGLLSKQSQNQPKKLSQDKILWQRIFFYLTHINVLIFCITLFFLCDVLLNNRNFNKNLKK